jgi:predicted Zn-dependent protease
MALTSTQRIEAATIFAMLKTCHKQLETLYVKTNDAYIGEAYSDIGSAIRQIEISVRTPSIQNTQEKAPWLKPD